MIVALSDVLSNRRLQGDTVTFTATEDWMQGRTMFGGFLYSYAEIQKANNKNRGTKGSVRKN